MNNNRSDITRPALSFVGGAGIGSMLGGLLTTPISGAAGWLTKRPLSQNSLHQIFTSAVLNAQQSGAKIPTMEDVVRTVKKDPRYFGKFEGLVNPSKKMKILVPTIGAVGFGVNALRSYLKQPKTPESHGRVNMGVATIGGIGGLGAMNLFHKFVKPTPLVHVVHNGIPLFAIRPASIAASILGGMLAKNLYNKYHS